MRQITVRNIDDAVYERLKAQAKRNHRSLAAEVRVLLTDRQPENRKALVEEVRRMRESTAGRWKGDSTAEIRKMRDRGR